MTPLMPLMKAQPSGAAADVGMPMTLPMANVSLASRGGWDLLRQAVRDLVGLGVIVLCLTAGSAAAQCSRSTISGNVLGLIVLLLLLWLRIVPITLVRGASSTLLAVLPILFVPLYVQAFSDRAFWLQYGPTLLPVVAVGCAATIVLARAVAIAMVKR
jgi:holin-like protein